MVLIYTQNWDGKFKKLSYELISYGVALAKEMNTDAAAVSIGDVSDDELKSLAKYGITKVYTVNDDKLKILDNNVYVTALSEVADKVGAKVMLFAHNNEGKALAPRLAAKYKAGLVTGVSALPDTVEPFVVTKKVFTGKAYTKVKVNSDYKVLTLFQNSFGVHENQAEATIEQVAVDLPEPTTKLIEQNQVTGKVLLTDAEIVVSGGRGMKSPDNWGPIEELAELLNGATACSRPVADEGWRPHSEHVGQTGKIIAPNLYFALGISGAIQHLGGVSNSKYIVAINIDKDAPIFEAADYGIIGDVHKLLPEMIEEVKKIKNA
jgi:electron transfer flavoprotein alpha subunit